MKLTWYERSLVEELIREKISKLENHIPRQGESTNGKIIALLRILTKLEKMEDSE